ncbi:MAG: carbohydrate ABC transporter permease, partial [Mycobacterium sp.]|nr:carbohydrate ABC transporter permease [Mycobacterium sp.]
MTGKRIAASGVKHLGLIAASVLMLGPFVWMLLSSLKNETAVFVFPVNWIPHPFQWSNYSQAWHALPFGHAYLNSFYIAVVIVVGQLLTSAMAAYAFARLTFRFREPLFVIFLATMMIPYQLTIIPMFLIMKELGLVDNHLSIILPNALYSAFGVFLLRQFIRSIPLELEDAAAMDGANRWRTFWLIVLPMLRSPLSALAIFSFVAQWNNFLQPLIFLNTPQKFTVPVLVAQFV